MDETKDTIGAESDAYKPEEVSPPKNIAEEVGLPKPDASLPPKNAAEAMAQILKEVKLPERKQGFRANADITIQPAPTPAPTESRAISEPEPVPRESVQHDHDVVHAVHTLKDDLQVAVHDKNLSLVQAAALEQEKRAHAGHEEVPEYVTAARRQHARSIAITVTALLFLGSLASGAVFLLVQNNSSVAPSTFLVEGLLFSEQTVPLVLHQHGPAELKRLLADVRTSPSLTLGAITRIAPLMEELDQETGETRQREATLREFMKAIDSHMPDELLRALDNEFFIGFHTVDENAPIIIVPVLSYERAFAGMLAWEQTMNGDLAPVFTPLPPLVRQSDGLVVERPFKDAVMRNYDARTLTDDMNAVQLYYSFPTRDILIIAESPYSFTEILSRLRADRRL